jgi:hypothetical protein
VPVWIEDVKAKGGLLPDVMLEKGRAEDHADRKVGCRKLR